MSWKDAGWPYASRTALTLRFLEFWWRWSTQNWQQSSSRVQGGWLDRHRPPNGTQGALWANQESNFTCSWYDWEELTEGHQSHPVVATEEAQFSAFNASLGAVAGGGRENVPTGRCTVWGSKHQSAVDPADDPAADPVCTGRSAAGKGAKQKEHHRYDTQNTILQKDIPSFSVCGGVKPLKKSLIGVQEFKSGDWKAELQHMTHMIFILIQTIQWAEALSS